MIKIMKYIIKVKVTKSNSRNNVKKRTKYKKESSNKEI